MAKEIMTEKGREKLCKAHLGKVPLPLIKKMGFGEGGVNANGTVIETTGKDNDLEFIFEMDEIFKGGN